MRRAWREADAHWDRAPYAFAAAVLGDTHAVGALADALASGELGLEIAFLHEVGASGLAELVPALVEGADYVEEELVLPYAAARIALGDPSGEQELRRALGDPDEELRLEALDYVSQLEDATAEALLRKARGSGPDLVRWYADLALAARSGESGVFPRAMLEADREVRALAVRFAAEAYTRSLGSRRVERALRDVLARALTDDVGAVRAAGLRAVSEVRLDGLEALVRENLRHDQEIVRIEAAVALLALGPQG